MWWHFWFVLGGLATLPLLLFDSPHLTLASAVFEAFSGLTTTGATVMTGLDNLPKAILFYRQFLQWLGGMGIIVLAIAIIPLLGIGGMQLYRAEMFWSNERSENSATDSRNGKGIVVCLFLFNHVLCFGLLASGYDTI